MTEILTTAAVFDRHADLTPPEYVTDDAEPFSVQYARVQTQVELWEAVRRYEQQNRSLDAEAAAIERALDRAEQAEALDPAEDRERAERRAEQEWPTVAAASTYGRHSAVCAMS